MRGEIEVVVTALSLICRARGRVGASVASRGPDQGRHIQRCLPIDDMTDVLIVRIALASELECVACRATRGCVAWRGGCDFGWSGRQAHGAGVRGSWRRVLRGRDGWCLVNC
jgi:hypothetical protein